MGRLPDRADRSALDYEPGQQIAGRYQVLEVLGHGASGVVYRVHDLTLGEEVAAKIIYDPEGGLERLKNEVRLARRVTHLNVCRVFDIVEHRHGALLTMEYVGGTTLAARIGVTHTDAEILDIARQICDALDAAHQAGVLHRDLKPHNVLLTREGRVVLTDFGIARPIASLLETDETHQPGTPAYMAPEQLSGEPLDSRTDLYAVGLILYELCTGHLPFVAAGETPRLRHVLKRLDTRIPPPKQHKRLAPLLFLLLAREPALRLSSAAVVKNTIARMQSGKPVAEARRGHGFTSLRILAPVLLILAAMAGYLSVASPPWRKQPTANAPPTSSPSRRTLTGGDEGITEPPTFQDGGKSLVIATNRTGIFQLWSVATDDALSRQLTSGPRGKHFPQVAGNYLYYSLERSDIGYDLVRLKLASLSTLQSGDEAEVVRPRIDRANVAANGTVVYLAPFVAGEVPGMHIVLPDGTVRSLLDDEGGDIRWPTLSPDAAHLAYLRQSSSGVALLVVELASFGTRVLSRDVLFGNGLSFSADSQNVAFFRGDGSARALVEVNRKTGAETVVLASAEHGTCPAHAEDGRLAYIDDQIDWDIWLYDDHARSLQQVTFLGDESAFSPAWSPALGELTYLVERPGHTSEVRRVGGATLAETRARRAIPTDVPYVAVSASGRYVAYSDRQGAEARLLLAEIDSTAPPVVLCRALWPHGFLPAEFAPGDARLTYVAHIGEDRESSIWDVKLDGTGARLVLASAGGGFRSTDGRWISFGRPQANEPGRFLLHVQETDDAGQPTGAPHAPIAYPLSSYRFAPNSRELIVLREAGLFSLDPRSGTERLLTRLPRGTLYPDRLSVSPDGRVAMSLGVGRQSLVVVDNYRALRR